jgi:adenylosuccinate lyase
MRRAYRTWLEVELAAAQAMERRGEDSPGVTARIRERARIDAADRRAGRRSATTSSPS